MFAAHTYCFCALFLLSACHCDRDRSDPKAQTGNPAGKPAASAVLGAVQSAAPVPTALPEDDACAVTCEAVAQELGCTNAAGCRAKCLTLAQSVNCKEPVQKFIACFTQQRAPNWTCDDDGVPLLGHVCEPEQNAISDCIRKHGKL